MKSNLILYWVMPLSPIRASVQCRQEQHTKRVNHTRGCPMLYAISYVLLNPDHNNKQNIVYWNWIDACL